MGLTIAIALPLDQNQAADFKNVGQSGANFLQIPTDAVGAALGYSNVASAKGAEGLYWNPAAIGLKEGTEIILSGADWILDTRLAHVGISHNFGKMVGAFGVSVTALTMDDMEITTELEPDGTGEYFEAGDIAAGFTYARAFTDRFTFGATAKYVYEYIWDAHSSALAFDFGSVFRTDFYNLRIGMIISNFGGVMEMEGESIDDKIDQIENDPLEIENDPRPERLAEEYSLPQYFNVGIAFEPYQTDEHRITTTIMVNDPNDNQTRASAGIEYAFNETFLLRAGYKGWYDEQTLSFGAGFAFKWNGNQARLDYAYSDFGVLNGINHLTLRVGI
jgi:hypothetical protein